MAAKLEVELRDVVKGIKAVDPDINWEEVMALFHDEELKEVVKNTRKISMLFTGRTGVGKSSLINGLIGRPVALVEAGVHDAGVTKSVECYSENINGVRATVYDSPGLIDGTGKDEQYLDEMYTECKDVDLIIFAVRISNERFVEGDFTAQVMVKFTRKFGNLIWRKTLVVVTCANLIEQNPKVCRMSLPEKQDFFKKDMSTTRDLVHRALREQACVPSRIVKKVRVVRTGSELQAELLDGTLWLTNFWKECFLTLPAKEKRISMLRMSAKRLKTDVSVTRADFEKPLDEQPIVISTKDSVTGAASTLGTVIIPAAVCGLVGALGLLGGPVGLVGIPVGVFVGMIGGAMMAASRSAPE